MRRPDFSKACLVGFLALCGCSSSSHGRDIGGGGQAGGDAGTSGSSGSNSGGEPSTGGTSAGGAGGAGAASGGDTSAGGASGGTAGGSSGGTAGDASGGTAGSGGGGAGGTGGTVVLPELDYVMYTLRQTPQFGVAQVRGFNPETGAEEFSGTIANPFPEATQDALPRSFVALPDGTLRAGWLSYGVSGFRIVQLDADLNVLGVVTAPFEGNFVDYAVRTDGARVLLSGGPGLARLTPLLADDSLDLSAAVTMITAGGPAPMTYFALAGSARVLMAQDSGGIVTALTADNEPTAVTHTPDYVSTTDSFLATGYHVDPDGTVRVSWSTSTGVSASRVCTYASENDLGTFPEGQGWAPGSCWSVSSTGFLWVRYTTFRR